LTNIKKVDFTGCTSEYVQINKRHNNLELPCTFENFEVEAEVFTIQSSEPYIIQLYGRGGHHSNNFPCDGCAIKARFRATTATNVKEIYHCTGRGYTNNRVTNAITYPSLFCRWAKLKVRVSNQPKIQDTNITPVRIEEYVDDVLVGSYVDSGGWATAMPPPSDCSRRQFDAFGTRASDEILNMAGHVICMRSDGETMYRFRYMRVREL
jgi:hypothetical protein